MSSEHIENFDGDMDNFNSFVSKSKILEWNNNNTAEKKLDFNNKDKKDEYFVYSGNVGTDIELLKILTEFKKKYPERVTLLIGNRDIDILSFVIPTPEIDAEIQDIKNILFDHYKTHISSSNKDPFSVENENKYQTYINKEGIERITTELVNKKIKRTEKSILNWFLSRKKLNEIIKNYLIDERYKEYPKDHDSNEMPDPAILGEEGQLNYLKKRYDDSLFKIKDRECAYNYLLQCDIMKIIGDSLFCNGILTEENFGYIPPITTQKWKKKQETKETKEPKDFVDSLNAWKTEVLSNRDVKVLLLLLNYVLPLPDSNLYETSTMDLLEKSKNKKENIKIIKIIKFKSVHKKLLAAGIKKIILRGGIGINYVNIKGEEEYEWNFHSYRCYAMKCEGSSRRAIRCAAGNIDDLICNKCMDNNYRRGETHLEYKSTIKFKYIPKEQYEQYYCEDMRVNGDGFKEFYHVISLKPTEIREAFISSTDNTVLHESKLLLATSLCYAKKCKAATKIAIRCKNVSNDNNGHSQLFCEECKNKNKYIKIKGRQNLYHKSLKKFKFCKTSNNSLLCQDNINTDRWCEKKDITLCYHVIIIITTTTTTIYEAYVTESGESLKIFDDNDQEVDEKNLDFMDELRRVK